MPELPEVEVLARHLAPLLRHRTIRAVRVRREKIIAPSTRREFSAALHGATFVDVGRRGKYLIFDLCPPGAAKRLTLVGHLGMTGRMYLVEPPAPLPKHVAAVFLLDRHKLVFEDTRYFGRLTLDAEVLNRLGPEPLAHGFTTDGFAAKLRRSAQPVKVKLLDQTIVAGIGNIYASEALFRARLSPQREARRLSRLQVTRLRLAVRRVLREAIGFGSTVPLDWAGATRRGALFYYGRAAGAPGDYLERLRVYDRQGEPCFNCGVTIQRIVQAARSTYFCPHCQK